MTLTIKLDGNWSSFQLAKARLRKASLTVLLPLSQGCHYNVQSAGGVQFTILKVVSLFSVRVFWVRRSLRECKTSATRSQPQASLLSRSPDKNFLNRCDLHEVISAFKLIRTDTTLDHSQKAEKVCLHALHPNVQWRKRHRACEFMA